MEGLCVCVCVCVCVREREGGEGVCVEGMCERVVRVWKVRVWWDEMDCKGVDSECVCVLLV